jgi:hypothetical protein
MGPGSHVGFPISAKNNNLVYVHPMNISGKFGSNPFRGFRKTDENAEMFIGWPYTRFLFLRAVVVVSI